MSVADDQLGATGGSLFSSDLLYLELMSNFESPEWGGSGLLAPTVQFDMINDSYLSYIP